MDITHYSWHMLFCVIFAVGVMTSLKGYIPGLARIIGVSADALYERQRALVRAGLIDAGTGRGPGSGVRTTRSSVALLIISVLAADRLTDAAERTRAIAAAEPTSSRPPLEGRRCAYTGMLTFADALAAILVGSGKADAVVAIAVSRTADRAQIVYREGRNPPQVVDFVGRVDREPGISVCATLSGDLLRTIAADVEQITAATEFGEVSQ